MSRVRVALVLGAVLLIAVALPARPAQEGRGERASLDAEIAKRAQRVYELSMDDYRTGDGDLEQIMDWSRRWADAEIEGATDRTARVAAAESQVARMRNIATLVESRSEAGVTRPWMLPAAEYHLLQARTTLANVQRE